VARIAAKTITKSMECCLSFQVQHVPGIRHQLSRVFFQRSNIYTSGAFP